MDVRKSRKKLVVSGIVKKKLVWEKQSVREGISRERETKWRQEREKKERSGKGTKQKKVSASFKTKPKT